MDLQPSEDQEALRSGAREFLRSACPPSLARSALEGDPEFAPRAAALWKQMVALDWPGLAVSEDHGGLGLGFVELYLLAEELGRVAGPAAFLATATSFTPLVREAGRPEVAAPLLRAVVAGETGTVALAEPAGRWEAAAVAATARPTRSGWVLSGTKSWVLDGAVSDHVAVVARGPGGLGVFVLAGREVAATPLAVADPSLGLARVDLDGVEVPPEGVLAEPGDPGVERAVARAGEEATAALAATTVGTCRTIFETTVQYLKDRQQFGRPIGSFQALKHRAVEMYLALEKAAALAAFAAATIAEDHPGRPLAVAMAKAAAGDCQRLLVQDGLQLHGGIGFTWDHDLHLYLKRAKSTDFLYGGARTHRAAVARLLGVAG
jgi:alkylation response protein AidB-like acyl-CoA dehydrogenase